VCRYLMSAPTSPPRRYLIAVTVYRKGAEVVRERLEADARTMPICSA
jgi:hypothetical protein